MHAQGEYAHLSAAEHRCEERRAHVHGHFELQGSSDHVHVTDRKRINGFSRRRRRDRRRRRAMSVQGVRAIRANRPGTALSARPGMMLPSLGGEDTSASGPRPHSAPANRPLSGKKKGGIDPNMAAHCSRVRMIANQPKSSASDRHTHSQKFSIGTLCTTHIGR